MTTSAAQAPISQHVAASVLTNGRRSLPPATRGMSERPVSQQWRERPRCPGPRVAPGSDDGVVHAIAGRAPCLRLCGHRVRNERAARAPMFGHQLHRTIAPRLPTTAGTVCVLRLPEAPGRRGVRIAPPHHRAFYGRAVLGIVNALRFASTRPVAGPAGIDDASARHLSWQLRDGGQCDDRSKDTTAQQTARTMLTRESSGRMLTSSRQCRAALPQFATTAYGARIRPTPSGHGFERTPHHIAARCTTTESGWSPRPMSCEVRDLLRGIVLRTMRAKRWRSTRDTVTPWSD